MRWFTVLVLLLLVPIVLAATNDPGHDSLYIEQSGDSLLTGKLNISNELKVANLFYSSQLDILGNGSQPTGSYAQVYTASSGNQLILNAPQTIFLAKDSGSLVQLGTSAVDLNVSGNATVQYNLYLTSGDVIMAGTTRLTSTGVGTFASGTTIAGQSVCLVDGTNCPVMGGGSSAGGWTNTTNLVSLYSNSTNVSIGNTTGNLPVLFVDNTNKSVGVGTKKPLANLYVNGTMIVRDRPDADANTVAFNVLSKSGSSLLYISPENAQAIHFGATLNIDSGGISVGNGWQGIGTTGGSSSDSLTFSTNTASTERMRLDGSGRLGINTTFPQNTLEVQGTINATHIKIGTTDVCLSDGTNCPAGVSPGGSDTQVQFNDNGAFNGSSNFTYDKTKKQLVFNGTVNTTYVIVGGLGANAVRLDSYDNSGTKYLRVLTPAGSSAGLNVNAIATDQVTSSTDSFQIYAPGNYLIARKEFKLGWSTTSNYNGARDVGLARGDTSTLWVTNGDVGSTPSLGNLTAKQINATIIRVGTTDVCLSDGTNCPAGATGTTGLTNTSGSGNISLTNNNVNISMNTVFIDNTNNRVGIGTSSPTQKLVVVGNVNVSTGNISVANTYSMCFNTGCTARIYYNGTALIIQGQ